MIFSDMCLGGKFMDEVGARAMICASSSPIHTIVCTTGFYNIYVFGDSQFLSRIPFLMEHHSV